MKLLNKLDRYLTDNEYKIIIKNNTINIINYIEIKDFNSNKIIIRNKNSDTIIEGTNLIVSKMQDNEALIKGHIASIKL